MPLRNFRHRLRRIWRRQRQRIDKVGQNAEQQVEANLLNPFGKFRDIWRFVLGWLLLFVLITGCLVAQLNNLKGYYQTLQPVRGGIFSEGITGTFTTANPLYATSEVDTSVSRLVFASLLKYDDHNQLVGDLADRWTVDPTGMIYTVHLRPNLTWHDGQPLTAADVVFTYQIIQNPDADSPLQSSWKGVAVAAPNNRIVTFTLPNPLSSFPQSLTTGIVPQHILGSLNPLALRSANFNTDKPIGAGPFRWSTIGIGGTDQSNAEEQISLVPFQNYWAGAPRLNAFNVHAYVSPDAMLNAYRARSITAMVAPDSMVPTSLAKTDTEAIYSLPLTAATMVFFKSSNPILQDPKVRQALVLGADRSAILQQLGYVTKPVNEPLLIGQLAYDKTYAQKTSDAAQAKALLDADGWAVGKNGIRYKNGQPLTFTLYATNTREYAKVANTLRDEWRTIGANVIVQLPPPADFQTTLSSHAYDAVLYGISIGVDPDVFVYWDSNQADVRAASRLNFSEYKSAIADRALEAGRTRLDDQLRAIKYKPFLQAWQSDAPALGLYQPRLLYISHAPIYGLQATSINTDADRFNNVQNWMIHTTWVTNP
jgi:peptide/nickel transport system substrate-binding protein